MLTTVKRRTSLARRITNTGLFVALALLLSYIETWLPFSFGVPGIKPGLANIVILAALYLLSPQDALAVTCMRMLLTGFFSGSIISLSFSLAGGSASFLVMFLLIKSHLFSPVGVSLAGGTAHNIAQFFAAVMLIESNSLLFYLPFLLLAGIVTGFCNGIIAAKLIPVLQTYQANYNRA